MSIGIPRTVSLLLLCVPTLMPAQAERGKGTWELSASAGAKYLDGRLQDYLASGPTANIFTNTTSPGRLLPAVALRAGFSVSQQLAFSLGGEASQGWGVTYLSPLVGMTYSAKFNERTSPFVTIGSQITRIVGQNERRDHPTWGAHAGIGIRQMLSDVMAMRIEGRVASEHYADLPGKKAAYPAIATFGISYFTGGPRPAPVLMASAGDVVPVVRWRSDTIRMVRVDTVRVVMTEPSVDQVILRVQFRTNFAELLPSSRPVLDTIARAIIETPGSRWEIQGHTDNVGSVDQNRYLSEERAKTVMNYLIGRGVDRSIMMAVGFGEARPVFSNDTPYGRAQNRRVQLRRIPPAPKGQPVP